MQAGDNNLWIYFVQPKQSKGSHHNHDSIYQETIARLWCDYNSYEQNISRTACVTLATYTYTLYYFVVMLVQLANNFNAPSQYKN